MVERQTEDRRDTTAVIEALVEATNEHDLDALVACFHDDYINETPAHPIRGFRGNAQVRRNWTRILRSVPDLRARVLRMAVVGDTAWTEWDMSGNGATGPVFAMRGVVIFDVREGRIASARFYLEPVEEASGDVNAAVSQVTGDAGAEEEGASS